MGAYSQSKKGGTSKSYMVDFVSKVENAFTKMKAGVDLETLQSECSQGTLYRAFSKYVDWAEQTRVNHSLKIRDFENEISARAQSLAVISKNITEDEKRHKSLSSQNKRLDELVDKRQEQFNELAQKNKSMNT